LFDAMAAEPLLASALLGDEELDALFGDDGKRRDESEIRVCTGVDGSGIVRGGVVGVWGDGGEVRLSIMTLGCDWGADAN
jgi:hypothetical protein